MKTSLNILHHQAGDWLRELDFYKEEITLLTRRLESVATANTGAEVLKQVEHFQNKFVLVRQQIDDLKQEVAKVDHHVNEVARQKPEHTNEKYIEMGSQLTDKITNLVKDIAGLRFQFNQFLSKAM